MSHKTLKVYLCGIRLWHIEAGFNDPTSDPLLQLVCRGIRRMQGDGCRIRLPITINTLHTIKRELRQSHYSLAEQRMLWSAFTLAFYGFLRASEYLNLRWSDITHTDKITVTLHQSKTDPFRKGHQVLIFPTNTSTCPVRALLLYAPLANRAAADDLLFNAGRFAPLTNASLNKALRILLKNAGLDQSQYASHSLRIGAATTAAAARIPAWMIKTLGRWNSNAYLSYIHSSPLLTPAINQLMSRTDAANQPPWDADEHQLN